jgi:hypothetical protein
VSSKSVLEVLKWCKSHFFGSKAVPKISVAIAALKDIHYALKPERLLRDPRDLSTRIRLPYQGNSEERRSAIEEYCSSGWNFKGTQSKNSQLHSVNNENRALVLLKKERHDARRRPPPKPESIIAPRVSIKLNNHKKASRITTHVFEKKGVVRFSNAGLPKA